MFQPHSIRGLISRRNNSRINEDSSAELPNNKDPDLESVIEAKLIIKGTSPQTKISNIKSMTFASGENIKRPSSTQI